MTVSYTLQVATCTGLGCFWKLLFRWRGSIWKLMWPNLVAFWVLVICVLVLHLVILSDDQKWDFRLLAKACKRDEDMIPIAFILGFYVEIVVTRWWAQYVRMPWPDNMAMYISTLMYGQDDRGRMIRRTVIRYCNLALVLTLRLFSTRIQRRFPTYEHLQQVGLLQGNEKLIMEHIDQQTKHPKYWMPLVWAGGIIVRARKEGRVRDDFSMKTLVDELNNFRGQCGGMIDYDWICIPLVYTQVVTLAVYLFIVTAVIGSQAATQKGSEFEIYFPLFSFMKLFFYMGWLKVAESLVNPWGDDDDDFEVNWMVDRHLQVSYMIVDEMHQEHPEMVKDQYWDEVYPTELPYTQASRQFNAPPTQSSHLGLTTPDARRVVPLRSWDVGEQEDEVDSGSDGDGDGEDTVQQREESCPVSITSIRPKSHRQLRRGEKGNKLQGNVSSHLLYQTETDSLCSLVPFPRTQSEEELFRMSDVSISHPRMKVEEEMPHRTSADTEEVTEPYHHLRSYNTDKEIVTDLRPVDLSVPDDDMESSWQAYSIDDWGAFGLDESTPVHQSVSEISPADIPNPDVKVIVPTGEPVRHTFGPPTTSVPSGSESEVEKQPSGPRTGILKDDFLEESSDKHVSFNLQENEHEMVATLPPHTEPYGTVSPFNLSPSASSSTSATLRHPLITPSGEVQGDQESPEVVIEIAEESSERPLMPYIPSPAIPVPAVSPAHTQSFDPTLEEQDMAEAARAARRGFHELEPISEQVESPQDKPNTSQHTDQDEHDEGGSSP